MTLFLDRHDLVGTAWEHATPAELLYAHQCDLKEQERFGVNYLTFWWHEGAKTAFCLVEAPNREAAVRVHLEAHGPGALPTDIIEVDWQTMEGFLGRIRIPPYDEIHQDIAFRTILCSQIEDPSRLTGGNTTHEHASIVQHALDERGGVAVTQNGDDLVACFASAPGALECALSIQQAFAPIASFYQHRPVRVRVGISAGDPVMAAVGIFGQTVHEASTLCAAAEPGEILVTRAVRDLCADKGFAFKEHDHTALGTATLTAPLYVLTGRDTAAALNGSSDTQITYPDTLTPREVEVLQLIAAGKTNQEIADLLFISLNTVATHVRNILDKTDSANRAEAASYALRHRMA
jgi:DNA-binding CsgD family transcriptional regulator